MKNFLSAGSGIRQQLFSRIPTVFSAKRMKRFPCSVPGHTLAREDGWRAFRIEGVLDFSLIGILAGISGILAENKIGIFVVSTYNTDYVLTKEESFERAMALLARHGYTVLPDNPSHSTDDNSLRNAEREGVAE